MDPIKIKIDVILSDPDFREEVTLEQLREIERRIDVEIEAPVVN